MTIELASLPTFTVATQDDDGVAWLRVLKILAGIGPDELLDPARIAAETQEGTPDDQNL